MFTLRSQVRAWDAQLCTAYNNRQVFGRLAVNLFGFLSPLGVIAPSLPSFPQTRETVRLSFGRLSSCMKSGERLG